MLQRTHPTALQPGDRTPCRVARTAEKYAERLGASRHRLLLRMIFMDPRIVDDSVEIPTRCSFVIEFIIPKFIEGSTRFERHTVHHQEL